MGLIKLRGGLSNLLCFGLLWGCGCEDQTNGNLYSVGGTLFGLASGASLVLQNNGDDDLTLDKNADFVFLTKLSDGEAYTVTVHIQPVEQTCLVSQSAGVIRGENVTNIEVRCTSSLTGGDSSIDESDSSLVEADSSVTNPQEDNTDAATVNDASVSDASRAEPDGSDSGEGDGSTMPLVGETDTDWAQVSAEWSHTCAVKTDGRLFCWGSNDQGLLGREGILISLTPIQEATAANDWAQVSTGFNHTCAVKTDGRLFCWGDNRDGRLANRDVMSGVFIPTQELTMADDWAQVSNGAKHTCAVKSDGRLFCWGVNDYGQLGNGDTENSAEPVQEQTAATDWCKVSTGSVYTCALKNDGRIFCWGANVAETLGDKYTDFSSTPVQEQSAADDWKDIDVGDSHICALKDDGRIFCWGYNSSGELGVDPPSNSSVPLQELTGANDWAGVWAGTYSTCAVKNDGRLFCWGDNQYLQLGNSTIPDGETSSRNSRTPVQEYTDADDWVSASPGKDHTCAVKNDGRLFCWGSSRGGKLGNNNDGDNRTPVQEYTAAEDWTDLAAGGSRTCALKHDGRIFCWGSGSFGTLGIGSESNSWIAVQEVTTANDWAEVSVGGNQVCALKTDGRLFWWGWGEYRDFGSSSSQANVAPLQEDTAADDWAQISADSQYSCAVKKDGRLFCWGYGTEGQLGTTRDIAKIPTQEVTAADDWEQVSTNAMHACAVKTDGTLFCWGNGEFGQLGNSSNADSQVPIQEYTAAGDWAFVATGYRYTCALKTDGRVFCWGWGEAGRLGNDSNSDSLTPVQEATLADDWVEISVDNAVCALKQDGRIFCWGRNCHGDLGDDTSSDSPIPVQEATLADDWVRVSKANCHTCALKRDGRIFCWGYNEFGQLGWPNFGPVWSTE